jgi:hypothetical protein
MDRHVPGGGVEMPLRKPNPSPETRLALEAGLSDLLDPRDRRGDELRKAPIGLQIFILGLRDIAGGAGMQAATPAGWRFLAGNPSGDLASADVVEPPDGSPQVMTSLSHDPLIAGAIRALHEVETLPEVQNNDYALVVLRIPALLIEAFWLRSGQSDGDLIIPVLKRARELQVMKAYPAAEFLNIVRPITAKFLKLEAYQAE